MKAGVIGLGAMGAPIAINLHRAGLLAAIWNRSAERCQPVTEQTGIMPAQDLPSVARECDVVILSVSADSDVLDVIRQLQPGCHEGMVVIDTSTVSAATARQAASILAEQQVGFIDAPVSGGVEGARNAKLSIMAGGDSQVLERVRPVLEAISARIVHLGPTGSGQATKAVNQIMIAGINEAVTEALAFAQAMDLPLSHVIEAVGGGAAGNWFLSHRGQTMVAGSYDPGFRIALHDKDLGICQSMAAEQGVELPLVEITRAHYHALIEQGFGDDDISGLFRLKRR
jgi:3-hydroxyisobutyrate dehydrogenase